MARKGYHGIVRDLNLAEQRLNRLFDDLPFDVLSEKECLGVLKQILAAEESVLKLLQQHSKKYL